MKLQHFPYFYVNASIALLAFKVLVALLFKQVKEEQRPDRIDAARHVGAVVLAHMARSSRLDAALR